MVLQNVGWDSLSKHILNSDADLSNLTKKFKNLPRSHEIKEPQYQKFRSISLSEQIKLFKSKIIYITSTKFIKVRRHSCKGTIFGMNCQKEFMQPPKCGKDEAFNESKMERTFTDTSQRSSRRRQSHKPMLHNPQQEKKETREPINIIEESQYDQETQQIIGPIIPKQKGISKIRAFEIFLQTKQERVYRNKSLEQMSKFDNFLQVVKNQSTQMLPSQISIRSIHNSGFQQKSSQSKLSTTHLNKNTSELPSNKIKSRSNHNDYDDYRLFENDLNAKAQLIKLLSITPTPQATIQNKNYSNPYIQQINISTISPPLSPTGFAQLQTSSNLLGQKQIQPLQRFQTTLKSNLTRYPSELTQLTNKNISRNQRRTKQKTSGEFFITLNKEQSSSNIPAIKPSIRTYTEKSVQFEQFQQENKRLRFMIKKLK